MALMLSPIYPFVGVFFIDLHSYSRVTKNSLLDMLLLDKFIFWLLFKMFLMEKGLIIRKQDKKIINFLVSLYKVEVTLKINVF